MFPGSKYQKNNVAAGALLPSPRGKLTLGLLHGGGGRKREGRRKQQVGRNGENRLQCLEFQTWKVGNTHVLNLTWYIIDSFRQCTYVNACVSLQRSIVCVCSGWRVDLTTPWDVWTWTSSVSWTSKSLINKCSSRKRPFLVSPSPIIPTTFSCRCTCWAS